MNKYKPICLLLILLSVVAVLSSCGSSKQVVYFQDLKPGETEFKLPEIKTITVRPEDKISIIVNSRDPQLTDLFNLPYVSRQLGQSLRTNGITVSNNQGVSAYTIDTNGEIDFPVLGKMYVAGMKREEIAEYIKNELIKENLVKDPVVTVEFANLCISVLGEVNNPGRFSIDRDRLTVLDALSMAGDLTIYGNRYKVMVLRQEGDVQRVYGIDLTFGGTRLYFTGLLPATERCSVCGTERCESPAIDCERQQCALYLVLDFSSIIADFNRHLNF